MPSDVASQPISPFCERWYIGWAGRPGFGDSHDLALSPRHVARDSHVLTPGPLNEDNLGRARAMANKPVEGQTLGALAYFALEQGRFQDAISMYKDVLRIDRDLGSALQTAIDICRFARAVALAGMAYADAGRLLACAEAIREEIGAGTPPYVAEIIEQALGVIRTHLDSPAFDAAWKEGRALTADEGIVLALGVPEPRLSASE